MVAWREKSLRMVKKGRTEFSTGPGLDTLRSDARLVFSGPQWRRRPIYAALAARRVHLGLIEPQNAQSAMSTGETDALWLIGLRPDPLKIRFLAGLQWQQIHYHDVALLDDVLRQRTLPLCLHQPRMTLDQALALSRWENVQYLDLHRDLALRPMTVDDWEIILAGRRLDAMIARHSCAGLLEYRKALSRITELKHLTNLGDQLQRNPDTGGLFGYAETPCWLPGAKQVQKRGDIYNIMQGSVHRGQETLSTCALGLQSLVHVSLAQHDVYLLLCLARDDTDKAGLDQAVVAASRDELRKPLLQAAQRALQEYLPIELQPVAISVLPAGSNKNPGRSQYRSGKARSDRN